MDFYKGEKEFFPGIGKIQFEGRDSKNPMAFHYYDENKVVMGKTLKDHLRFAKAVTSLAEEQNHSPGMLLPTRSAVPNIRWMQLSNS